MARVLLSLGSNIEREHHLREAVRRLGEAFGELRLSPVYETPAQGFVGPSFYNMVVGLETEEPPREVNRRLKAIEDRLGRTREGERFSSRTIDIDLLTWGDLCLDEPGLTLPREEILRNAFVLKPLADIAGDLPYPGTDRRIADLWQDFAGDRRLRPVALEWEAGLE